jgi:hypothetical protein
MHVIGGSRSVLAVAGSLAAIGALALTGCSADSTPQPVASVLNAPLRIASASPSSSKAKPSASASASKVQNLIVSTSVRTDLTDAFAAASNFPVSYVKGTAPNSVYYAYTPATDTYWALATFEPSATATKSAPADFQDGSNVGEFKKVGDGSWQAGIGGEPVGCGELRFFPKAVLAAWSISPPLAPCG